jgi:hypothetical protein
MSEIPTHELELKAAGERKLLHESLAELRERIHESIDVKATVGRHVLLIAGIAGLASLVLGYGLGGVVAPNYRVSPIKSAR